MNIEQIPLSELTNDPRNVREHDKRNVDAIAASLQRFGQQKPIVVDSEGVVLAGNGTLAAARSIGWEEIAIVRTDLMDAEAVAYAIADNRTADLATWDTESLALTLDQLDDGQRLAAGYDQDEFKSLLDQLGIDESGEPAGDGDGGENNSEPFFESLSEPGELEQGSTHKIGSSVLVVADPSDLDSWRHLLTEDVERLVLYPGLFGMAVLAASQKCLFVQPLGRAAFLGLEHAKRAYQA